MDKNTGNNKRYTIIDTLKSVLLAFWGVQSEQNRHRDFVEGKFSHFVIIGLVMVIAFITLLMAAVTTVISLFGS